MNIHLIVSGCYVLSLVSESSVFWHTVKSVTGHHVEWAEHFLRERKPELN